MKNNFRQRQASMRSPWRATKLARDRGERYKITYRDPLGTLRVFGYADSEDDLAKLVAKLDSRTSASHRKVIDRHKKKGTEAPHLAPTA